MFGIGGPELAVILVLALLFVGPKKLPQVARTVGGAIRDLKRAANMAQSELRETVDELLREADLQDTFNDLRRDIETQPEERLKEVRSDPKAKALATDKQATKQVEVSPERRHPDIGFHIDNDDFDEAIDDDLEDEALYDEIFGPAARVGAQEAGGQISATEISEGSAAGSGAEIDKVTPAPAPERPAPAMQRVEGTVSWRDAKKESGEA